MIYGKQIKMRGNTVTISDRIVSDISSDRTSFSWKKAREKIAVYRGIAELARKIPETSSIKNTMIHNVRNFRQAWKEPTRKFARTILVCREYTADKKRRKELALLRRYNARNYTNIEYSRSVNFEMNTLDFSNFSDKVRGAVVLVNHKVRTVREFFSKDAVRNKQKFIPSLGMTVTYTTINGTMAPGELERVRKQVKSQQIWAAKKPTTLERHVGIEIECFGPVSRETLGVMLVDAGVGRYVELKSDGSIRPNKSDEHSFEVAIVSPKSKLAQIVQTVCEVLSSVKCKVNKSCGLHVHLDTRTDHAHKMFSNLVSAQSILYAMQPLSRRQNTYCEKTSGKDLTAEARKGKRYLGINPMSYNRHRTIEVRLHSGTIEARKILNFVAILSAVAYKDEYTKRGAHTIKGFVKQNKLSAELEQYITERINKFNTEKEIEEAS